MLLDRLVLDGFKSFYTRTTIDFSPGITAIVGPNGCGKSNILDAVRWVLGEQSAKQLRGEEISDIISAGNARRSAKRRAEAYLTFSQVDGALDTDRDQIEVGRAVDREGKGTYMLNGDTVRLRDIKDLFRDTGVGQDLYSIIGQGEIRNLVESRPEELREILEEAAGVASYRHRRDLTLRRLDQTREEFETISSELKEKQGRLNQLKGQAEKARKVREVQTQLRRIQVEQIRREYFHLRDQIGERTAEKQTHRKQLQDLQTKKDQLEKRLTSLEQARADLDSRLQHLQAIRAPLVDEYQQTREDIGRLETRSESLREQLVREKNRLLRLRERKGEELEDLIQSHQHHYRLRVSLRVLRRRRTSLENHEEWLKTQNEKLNRRIETIQSQTLFQVNEESEIRHRLDRIQNDLNENRNQQHQLRNQIQEYRDLIQQKRDRFSRQGSEWVQTESARVRARLRTRRLGARTRSCKDLYSGINEAYEDQKQTLRVQRSQLETIQSLQKSYEGYVPGVQRVMKAHREGRFPDILGVLANLIDVPDSFNRAYESCLGTHLQSVVLKHHRKLSELQEFLESGDGGRATFLCLDQLRSSSVDTAPESFLDAPGVLDRADRLLECSADLKPLVTHLLGDVVIVKGWTEALDLFLQVYSEQTALRILTPQGVLLDASGQAQLGTPRASDGAELLGRKQKISSLQEQIQQRKGRLRVLEEQRARLKTRQQTVQDLLEQEDARRENLRSKSRAVFESLNNQRREWKSVRSQQHSQLSQLVRIRHRDLRLSYQDGAAQTLLKLVSCRETRQKSKLRSLRQRHNQTQDRMERLQREWRRLESRLQEAESRLREITNQIEQNRRQRQQNRVDRRELQRDLRSFQSRWKECECTRTRRILRLRLLRNQEKSWDELIRDVREQRSTIQDQLQERNQTLQKLEASLQQRRAERDRNEQELANQQARLDEVRERMKEEFDLSPNPEALRQVDTGEVEEWDSQKLATKQRSLQQRLRDLRPVNMLADQQFQELDEDVQEIREQRKDLEEACEKMEAMIRRLNTKARAQFKEAFAEIKDYFSDFVTELFRGGNGRLQLTDDPVLESGVNIEIEPPGERLKTMSALSGGEKSLAALAFLFALFERKPTPFCFLDEVDAALDDENVEQFVELLNRYKDRTQFVVVTHNKGTMQCASQLYGVTMEESGISKTLRMDLEEAVSVSEIEDV